MHECQVDMGSTVLLKLCQCEEKERPVGGENAKEYLPPSHWLVDMSEGYF